MRECLCIFFIEAGINLQYFTEKNVSGLFFHMNRRHPFFFKHPCNNEQTSFTLIYSAVHLGQSLPGVFLHMNNSATPLHPGDFIFVDRVPSEIHRSKKM